VRPLEQRNLRTRALWCYRALTHHAASRRWQEVKKYIEGQMAEAAAAKEKRLASKRRNA
jgi:hypothetical protein